jgi:two-component system NarL family sensor kinase
LRHADASRLELAVDVADGCLTVSVADDGKGFDPSSVEAGLGLLNMRERTEALDGELQITSRPGRTVIRLTAPIDRRGHEAGRPPTR